MSPQEIVNLLNDLLLYSIIPPNIRIRVVDMADEIVGRVGCKITTTDTEPPRYTIRTLDSDGL